MFVTWQSCYGADVTCIFFSSPCFIFWHFYRRKAYPFGSRCATIIPIKPGMIHQNRKAASYYQYKEKKLTQWLRLSHNGNPVGYEAFVGEIDKEGSAGNPNSKYCIHAAAINPKMINPKITIM